MRLDIAEETQRLARPVHEQLSQSIRLMWLFADAWADHNWPVWETALLAESDRSRGWTPTRTRRLLNELQLTDMASVFTAAGLTDRQRQVMERRFPDNGSSPAPRDIARELGWPALRVRVHLHEGYDRLKRWASRVDVS